MTGAAVLAFYPISAHAQANTDAGAGNYYFFGDSAIGQGNYAAIVGEQGADHSPYSSNNGFQRESNGLIWAEMLGRDVDIVLDPDADSSNINFAISGAHMTSSGDLVGFGIQTGVITQTELFGNLVDNDTLVVGDDDVAFILAGANDYLDRLLEDDPADEIMTDVALAASANVHALADAGVKTIILSEMQPIQNAPEFSDAPEVQAAHADLVDETNAAMLIAVDSIGLPADVNVITMKYGDLITYITSNTDALGFTNISGSCFDSDTSELCSDNPDVQNAYLFFDDLHFSERAHRLEAQWWGATLAGANGKAAGQTAHLPRVVYEQVESHRSFVRPGTHTNETDRLGAWLAPISSSLNLKAAQSASAARLSLDGAVLGMEGRFSSHFIVGSAISVGKTAAKFSDGGRYRLEGGALSLYGALDYQDLGRLSLTATKGGHEVKEITRVTGVDLLSASGQTDTRYWDVELAARSTNVFGHIAVDHGLALSAGRIGADGYIEAGADGLSLSFENQAFNYRRLSIDALFRGPSLVVSDRLILTPLVDAEYAWQFGDDDYGLTSRLTGNTAQPVTIRRLAPEDSRFDVGLGAELAISERWLVSVRYAHQWADDIHDADAGSITLRTTF
jgi:phospholipase/lecithinase/hemolysin